jgi:hypothetical protein
MLAFRADLSGRVGDLVLRILATVRPIYPAIDEPRSGEPQTSGNTSFGHNDQAAGALTKQRARLPAPTGSLGYGSDRDEMHRSRSPWQFNDKTFGPGSSGLLKAPIEGLKGSLVIVHVSIL